MSYWWYPSNWWSPDKVTNVKAYLLYIFFSTKGRIGPWNWFVAWLFLTIILYYFFSPVWWGNQFDRCWEMTYDNPAYDRCYEQAESEWNNDFFKLLGVWVLLLYPYCAISVKRFHDIGYGGEYLIWCILGIILIYLGILAYFYFMLREGQPHSNKYGTTFISLKGIWDYESREIEVAVKWEVQNGYREAIQIHRKLGRMGDVRRLERLHIKYLWDILVSKFSDMKAKRIDCTGLEISTSDLNSKLAESFNIKDGK